MAYADAVLADSPLHYWRLHDTGSTMAAEVGDAGAHTGGALDTSSPTGGGRTYDGTDDESVVTGLDLTAETAITVEFLAKVATWTSGRLLYSHDAIGFTTSQPKFGIEVHSGVPYPTLQNSGQQYHDESFAGPSDGAWHHYAIRYDRGTDAIDVIIDGLPVTTTGNRAEGMTANFGVEDFTIGSRGGAAFHPLVFSEFAIYSGLLSDSAIEDHVAALDPAPVELEVKGIPSTFVAEGVEFEISTAVELEVKGVTSTLSVGAPLMGEPVPVDIEVRRVFGAASVGRPRLRMDLDITPTVQAFVGATELTDTFDRSWQEVLSDTGNGELSIMNDDAQLALLPHGALVRFSIDEIVRFTAIVEKKGKAAAAEGADQVTKIEGRGLLAEWEDAIVQPYGGAGVQPTSDTRTFNWASPGIDPDGWVNSHNLFPQSERDLYASITLRGLPPDWPEEAQDVYWIWGIPWVAMTPHPIGDNYFRSWFTAPADTSYSFFVAGDNGWELWIDGIFFHDEGFPSVSGYAELHRIEVELTAGPHLIAAKATNFFGTDDPVINARNYGGLIVAVFNNSGAVFDNLGARVHETAGGATWKALPYPDHPTGWPIGRIIRTLLEEAQARGGLTGWTLGFTDDLDSDGNPWPIALETSFEVGLDMLSMLRQLAETYMEFKCSPTQRKLYAYVDGAAGLHTSVEFQPAVNVMDMAIEEEA
jgi:hypothetical protein